MPGIISHRLLANLANFYPTTVSIQANTPVRSNTGQQTEAWSTVTGLGAIPAAIAAVPAGDRKQMTGTFALASHRIALRGHYPTITTAHQATGADATVWNIRDVQHDSQSTTTYLLVERVVR